jgi:hypothetical protein
MTDDDVPISYQAAVRGTPVLSSTGATIGTLEHVLEVPEVDVFDGIVIATDGGLRFIDADQIVQITRSCIRSDVDDAQARQLPPPDGPPVYRVDALADTGHSLHDVLGRLFRRPHWIREDKRYSPAQLLRSSMLVGAVIDRGRRCYRSWPAPR